MYALITNDTITETVDSLPNVWNDGTRDWDLRPMNTDELAALGWYQVVPVAPPPDTATTTFDYSVGLVNGKPTDVWTERPMTPVEQAAAERQTNTDTIVTESGQNVDKLITVVAELNAITDLTNATINANPAAVIKDIARNLKTVARQVNHGARIVSGETDSTYTGPEE